MGCRASVNIVQPLTAEEGGEQDGAEVKGGARGDSAVSKGTTDSGVVMEGRERPALPGAVPVKLPALTSASVTEESGTQERLKSSEILDELLNEGIIPAEHARGTGTRAGEAYSIMLDDSEDVRHRPPVRLESLKAKKTHSKDELDEKMRRVEERRKSREDDLKTRLRSKSARVRRPAPASAAEEEEGAACTFVEALQLPISPDLPPASQVYAQSRAAEGEIEGNEWTPKNKSSGDRETGEKAEQQKEEEEVTPVEQLGADKALSAIGELQSDSSFLYMEEEIF